MTERTKPHLFVTTAPTSEPFRGPGAQGGAERDEFPGDRAAHGRRLEQELRTALRRDDDLDAVGTYVTFASFPGLELALASLDSQRHGDWPELVSVAEEDTVAGPVQWATVYIPDGRRGYLLKKLSDYVDSVAEDSPKNAVLVEGIESIRKATIRQLWTDSSKSFPADNSDRHWWELWLRHRDGNELSRLREYARQNQLLTGAHYLGFADRTVLLMRATTDELSLMFDSLDDLAEIRHPHEIASIVSEMTAYEQAEWVEELRTRLHVASEDAPTVCVVDTGVQESHPLLVDSLSPSDIHVIDPSWSKTAKYSHGTEMAGLALYEDLHKAVLTADTVRLGHRLESVKFLPDRGNNEPDLYGAVTARAVDRPEIQAPHRRRAFMLAVTAHGSSSNSGDDLPPTEDGKPTSWSSAIDALAFGRSIDDNSTQLTYLDRDEIVASRLFIISAGNIRDVVLSDDHLQRCDIEPVEDPAQAWNALTVGAYTDKVDMAGANGLFDGYRPLAPRGELAAVSRTSVSFDSSKWPFKPDVVAEGGNIAVSPDDDEAVTPECLAVLTTRLQDLESRAFTTTRDTSAATAQVAAVAGAIMAQYPHLRAETVRALIVHSAEWTTTMKKQFGATKGQRGKLLRRYGMGVPSTDRALRSAADALTLISEATIRPFERENNSAVGRAREMNLHELPWPSEQLEALGETEVRLRVTLSYFVEPNPSNRGWTGRYVYPSHGLRFAVRRPEDNLTTFRQRVNLRAREEGEKPLGLSTEQGWYFGTKLQQSAGSLCTDIWTGPAAALANKGDIAVFPVAGWWKDRRTFDQSDRGVHYSLVVSIESPSVEVDLWTPVAQKISQTIAV